MDQRRLTALLAAATGADPAEKRILVCQKLVRAGYFEAVEQPLTDLVQMPEVAAEARKLLAVSRQLKRWGIVGELERYEADPNTPDFTSEAGVMLARRPNARKVIFVFTGAAKQVWISIHLLHQVLPKDDCHVVYLRDHMGLCYLKGVDGLGDTYHATLDGMQALIRSLGDPAVYCMGSSGGGYGALRYGLDLGAEAVLAFSPSTDTDNLEAYLADLALENIFGSSDVAVDIRRAYGSAATPPRVDLVFGERHEKDAEASRRLGDLPMVTLHPVAGYEHHDVVSQVIATGMFGGLLDRLLTEDVPAEQMAGSGSEAQR